MLTLAERQQILSRRRKYIKNPVYEPNGEIGIVHRIMHSYYVFPDASVLRQCYGDFDIAKTNMRLSVLKEFAAMRPPDPQPIVEYNKYGMNITKIWDCSCGRRPCFPNAHGRD